MHKPQCSWDMVRRYTTLQPAEVVLGLGLEVTARVTVVQLRGLFPKGAIHHDATLPEFAFTRPPHSTRSFPQPLRFSTWPLIQASITAGRSPIRLDQAHTFLYSCERAPRSGLLANYGCRLKQFQTGQTSKGRKSSCNQMRFDLKTLP